MTWTSFHRRGEVLREVIAAADARRDGVLPRDVDGVSATFSDDLELLGALQLKWHTRLAGRIEREQVQQPMDLRASVVRAWHRTADELAGIRMILDEQRARPADPDIAAMMAKAAGKEHLLLAVMAGEASAHDAHDARAAAAGARIEQEAKATWPAYAALRTGNGAGAHADRRTFLDRLKAALAA